VIARVTDSRKQPRVATRVVIASALVMILARLGSLHSLEKTRLVPFWKKWIGSDLASADSMGRIVDLVDPESLRAGIHQIYTRHKRNKAIIAPWQGLISLTVDGHESHATYKRHCLGCLERTIHADKGDKIQYYHRHVTALLGSKSFCLLLDAEPQRPGEDEVACAIRLIERIIGRYPKAFDVVMGDALYTDPRFYEAVTDHGKEVLTVLKDERRDLIQDAKTLFAAMTPQQFAPGNTRSECWDLEGFTSWPQFKKKPVRVIAARETSTVHRQLSDQDEQKVSEWMWVTTLSRHQVNTLTAVQMVHSRWDIENRGFNETSNYWHADHLYKHGSTAMLNFWLMTMMAYNLFHAFFHRDLKPALRNTLTYLHLARMILATLYEEDFMKGNDSS
jgi:hypothetical protein